jgi:hypothetical protein
MGLTELSFLSCLVVVERDSLRSSCFDNGLRLGGRHTRRHRRCRWRRRWWRWRRGRGKRSSLFNGSFLGGGLFLDQLDVVGCRFSSDDGRTVNGCDSQGKSPSFPSPRALHHPSSIISTCVRTSPSSKSISLSSSLAYANRTRAEGR